MLEKRVLVTGGAGFIGSHLVTELVKKGYNVTVIDNESTGNKKNLDEAFSISKNKSNGSKIHYEYMDIKNSLVEQLINDHKSEIVFHLAAIGSVPRSIEHPLDTWDSNGNGTFRLLEASRKAGVKRFIFASSSSVYGDHPALPKVEEKTGKPLSPYALSKQIDEDIVRFYNSWGLETVSLRYFNVFGSRQDPNSQYAAAIPKFITAMLSGNSPTIFGDGEQSRDFTYVDNVVKANLLFSELPKEKVCGQTFNVACGSRYTVNDLVSNLNNILGTSIKPEYKPERPGDIKHSHADISKAKFLGYNPHISFKDGLRKTVEYYKRQLKA